MSISIAQAAQPTLRIKRIGWLLTLALILVGPAALSYDVCIASAEFLIAVLFLIGLRRKTGKANTIEWIAGAWCVTQIAGTAWGIVTHWGTLSPYPEPIYNGGALGPFYLLIDQLAAVACFYAVYWSGDDFDAGSQIEPLMVVAVAVALLGLAEEFRMIAFGTNDPRLQSSFTNPNLFGVCLCLLAPITIAESFRQTYSLISRRALAALGITLIALVFLTQSRGAILGSAVAMTFLAAAFWVNRPALIEIRQQRSVMAGRLLILSCAAIVAVGLLLFPRLLLQSRSVSDDQRETTWRGAVLLIEQHPITGLGNDSFPAALSYLHLMELNPNTANGLPKILSIHLHAHDLVLQSWEERGLIGLASTIALILWILFSAKNILRGSIPVRDFSTATGSVAALIGFLVFNISDYALWFAPVSILFWFVLGLAAKSLKPVQIQG